MVLSDMRPYCVCSFTPEVGKNDSDSNSSILLLFSLESSLKTFLRFLFLFVCFLQEDNYSPRYI